MALYFSVLHEKTDFTLRYLNSANSQPSSVNLIKRVGMHTDGLSKKYLEKL